ncbi:MAG: hypothetical protein JWQ88_1229 [Rhodoferax sp.]|nr:hypothetical protein [Rhodoferax sp.]
MSTLLKVGVLSAAVVLFQPSLLPAQDSSAIRQDSNSTSSYRYASDVAGSAYEWLEREQKGAYGDSRRPPDLAQLRAIVKSLPQRDGWEPADQILDAVGIDKVVLPTRYEDIGGYLLMQNLSDSVRKAMSSKSSGTLPPRILWGTLPHGEVNAASQRINDEHLVILNHGVFTFLYAALVSVSRTISLDTVGSQVRLRFSEETFAERFANNPRQKVTHALILQSFADQSRPPDFPFASLTEAPILIRQLNAIERFIVGHEYAHIEAGDTARGSRTLNVSTNSSGWHPVASMGRDWKQELRADSRGLELGQLARTADESGNQKAPIELFDHIAAYAPLLYLALADGQEDLKFCMASGEGGYRTLAPEQAVSVVAAAREIRDSAETLNPDEATRRILGCRMQSHPPAWVRLALMEQTIDRSVQRGPHRPPVTVEFSKALIRNAISAYDQVRPALRRAHEQAGRIEQR